jgi:hypothetical protein
MPFVEDPDRFLADFGVLVTFGTQTALAIFDQPDSEILSRRAQTTGYRITYSAAKLTGLGNGSVVSIAGEAYTALGTPNKIEDGVFLEATLEKT